ncbi:MYND-type domain-containing protein [Mycena kentingensis (nom. inval.)]|nr:MYND-type domain-containing protein [Mycena kentingensis (nom. inval.)]
MHPSLRLTNLSQLPLSIRTAATAAARHDGSLEDVRIFTSEHILLSEGSARKYLPRMLCVLYHLMDAEPILHLLEKPHDVTSDELVRVQRVANRAMEATFALVGMMIPDGPPHELPPLAAIADVWPRLWAWVEFYRTFGSWDLPGIEPPYSPEVVVHAHCTLLSLLASPPWGLQAQISACENLYLVLGQAATALIDAPASYPFRLSGLGDLWRLLCLDEARFAKPTSLADFILAAGGLDHVAHFCVEVLRLAAPIPPKTLERQSILLLSTAFSILTHPTAREMVQLRESLRSFDLTKHVVAAFHALSLTPCTNPTQRRAERHAFLALRDCLVEPTMYRLMHESLADALRVGTGFLPAMRTFFAGQAPTTEDGAARTTDLITGAVFPFEACMSLQVVKQLRRSHTIEQLEELGDTAGFSDPSIAAVWQQNMRFLQSRITLLDRRKEGLVNAWRGCDNPLCGKLHVRSSVRRCSQCLCVQYCSKECQKLDWKQRHRGKCQWLSEQTFMPGFPLALLRIQMNDDYAANRSVIAHQLLQFFSAHAGQPDTVPYLIFNYSDRFQPASLSVHSFADSPELAEQCAEQIDRAKASDGRYRIHFFTSTGEPGEYYNLIPFYSTSNLVMRGLKALAEEIRKGEGQGFELGDEGYESRVRELLEREVLDGTLATH